MDRSRSPASLSGRTRQGSVQEWLWSVAAQSGFATGGALEPAIPIDAVEEALVYSAVVRAINTQYGHGRLPQ
jgi:hypothetical protein